MATALISALCVWTSFTTNTQPPPDAFAAGFYHLDGGGKTSPLYVVRLNETGSEAGFGWQRSRSHVVVHGVRNFDDIHFENQVSADILTCKGLDKITMRWVNYHPWIDMEQCMQLGRTTDGERIYLARIHVKDHLPASAFLPARFIPSSGLALTEHYGAYATEEFKLFCKIQI